VQQDQPAVAVATPSQAQAGTKVASAAPSQPPAQESEGFFASLGRKMGITGASADTTATATAQPTRTKAADAKPLPKAFKPVETKPAAETRQVAASRPPLKPAVADAPTAAASEPPPPAPAKDAIVAGAQPIVPTNSFDSRFSAAK
jgi:hypothetical protein